MAVLSLLQGLAQGVQFALPPHEARQAAHGGRPHARAGKRLDTRH
jgi:hypothetical protein